LSPGFDLQGHRGAAGLAPENSLVAFATALAVGVTTLELDVAVTRDGAVIVDHERHAPDGRPWVELTLAATRSLVPRLDEVFELAADRGADDVRFAIEAKLDPAAPDETVAPDAFAARILECVARHGVTSRSSLMSFDWRVLVEAKRLLPGLATAALAARDTVFPGTAWTAGIPVVSPDPFTGELAGMAAAIGAAAIGPHHEELTDELIAEAHGLGLRVHAWTVNDPVEMDALIGRGVDGLATDFPDRARAVLAARGLPLPVRYPPPESDAEPRT
jgi:glycerophosphoryl diester phosphodiesterase